MNFQKESAQTIEDDVDDSWLLARLADASNTSKTGEEQQKMFDMAFTLIVEHYELPLYRFAYKLTESGPEAEDIVQFTFLQTLIALRTRSAEAIRDFKLHAWLYKVAYNRSMKYHHQLKLAKTYFQHIRDAEAGLGMRPEEVWSEIFDAMERLPPKYREVADLYYREDMPAQEIADHLREPLGTIKNRIFRLNAMLREALSVSDTRKESQRHGSR